MIVDTHLHVVDRTALDYPWLSGTADLNRDWHYSAYEREARRAGIVKTLHMEVDVAPQRIADETEYVAALAARPESLIAGAIARVRRNAPARSLPVRRFRCSGGRGGSPW